jgi:CheY-like chemotaxis protein
MTEQYATTNALPKLLIADDDPSIVKFLSDRCIKAGFEVQTAANGVQAALMMRRNQPQLAIVDVNMPGVDGLTACSRMLGPGSPPLDIIVITGRPDAEVKERCDSFGTFYAEKGPDFWSDIQCALTEVFPYMEDRLQMPGGSECDVRQRPLVLLVDDDLQIEGFLSSRLRKAGFITKFASDATRAFRMARRDKPSVIVSDYYMPNGDAHYLLSRLRTATETESIPVLVISGRELDAQAEQSVRREFCGRPGAVRVFNKMFDIQEIVTEIQKYCV